MAATQRYWNGQAWTEHVAPAAPSQPASYARPGTYQPPSYVRPGSYAQPSSYAPPRSYAPLGSSHTGLIVAGVITALLIPLIGFIIGIVLMVKGKVYPGLGCMVIAVMAFIFWMDKLSAGTATTYTGY
jgi:hypothetical protein